MSAESMATDPYEVVLADLRAKKAQIEQAISAIEALRGGANAAAGSGSPLPATPGSAADVDSPGAFLGMSIADAAKKLLAAKRQHLRNPEIAAAFKRGGLVLNSKDAVNTIGSVLTRRANEVGDIVKVGRGTWGLKEWHRNLSAGKRPAGQNEPEKGQGDRPFALTDEMRNKLAGMQFTNEEIDALTPEEAMELVGDLAGYQPG
jgi:hypothetical protein